ncbi:uncharacterized protein B0H18DRAFT_162266 [Fomitopsis serialis]|uniref:uncharacterized protein n=1 Tax=Fomitopsis serialis TaxID=139415 RepID=UPI002007A0ED|nr:uncharacterized protein B0H18DRAFT_162266 [Neoantrodia serialis]KAH9930125.1 hypothetical protein B0H18DRAFT_162266 [Neoantrodia serialis]
MFCLYHRNNEEWYQDYIANPVIASHCPCMTMPNLGGNILSPNVGPGPDAMAYAYTSRLSSTIDSDVFWGAPPQRQTLTMHTSAGAYPPGPSPTIDPCVLCVPSLGQTSPQMTQNVHPASTQMYPTYAMGTHQQLTFELPFKFAPKNETPLARGAQFSPIVANVASPEPAPITSICHFGGPCPRLTPDMPRLSTSGVQRHLEAHHRLMKDDAGKLICQWTRTRTAEEGASICQKHVKDMFQLARHVASVHLGALRVQCEGCKGWFVRSDSLRRHKTEDRCSQGVRIVK